ncbi:hypothetical protein GCK72_016370 [Caenorhabditis remanei]|uniref:Uncharacterized protein n=1 Tax=Caenorhabditis remanei TaxID=31234 RepID=A0A6A5GZS5_CAERE|nr:hypothetical protein GCK72_016370 [Caenorhabditis remanei]KAF1759903.1 hypothetical protein GCK72_016370 [Caenorhabditis remanei]
MKDRPVFILFLTCVFIDMVSAGRVMKVEPLDYNLEIDKTLSGIESSVRNQSDNDFQTYFSESFDSIDWYRKFLGKLTPDQAATYSVSPEPDIQLSLFQLSRFGDVKDERAVQFTESVKLNDTSIRRTPFDAVFLEVENERRLVIDSLMVHDGKYANEEEH